MSFLFEEVVLAKLLVESGLFNSLSKYGQQVDNEAKQIAVKLTNNLMNQAINQSSSNDLPIYVQNLVDLDSYLNFLVKNGVRATGGKLITYHDASGTNPSPDAEAYTKYKEFYVLKDGLLEKLRELDIVANQVGNEVMKPLVKGLISQINNIFGITFESAINPPANPYENIVGQDQLYNKSDGQHGNVNSGQYKNVSFSPDSEVNNLTQHQKLQEDIIGVRNTLPFQSSTSISPYDITLFIRSMAQLLNNHKNLITGPMLGQFQQFNSDIERNWTAWQNFISRVDSTGLVTNVKSLRDEVPYDRANRPNTTLENLFGNNLNAKEAAQRLLQMVNLTQQAILSINRSPQMVDLLGKDVLNNQANQTRLFIESLTPFARS